MTASLMLAYALAVYANHLIFIPRYWQAGKYGRYTCALLATMAVLTAAALGVICFFYFKGGPGQTSTVYTGRRNPLLRNGRSRGGSGRVGLDHEGRISCSAS